MTNRETLEQRALRLRTKMSMSTRITEGEAVEFARRLLAEQPRGEPVLKSIQSLDGKLLARFYDYEYFHNVMLAIDASPIAPVEPYEAAHPKELDEPAAVHPAICPICNSEGPHEHCPYGVAELPFNCRDKEPAAGTLDFIYKLDRMENAAQSDDPFRDGYKDKRDAVIKHVHSLESRLAAKDAELSTLRKEMEDARRYRWLLENNQTMLRNGNKLSLGITFHTLVDWEPDHFENTKEEINAAIDAAMNKEPQK